MATGKPPFFEVREICPQNLQFNDELKWRYCTIKSVPNGQDRWKKQSVGVYFGQHGIILSAELTKTHSDCFFGDFAH